ncbi:MAG: discoidin domain-containing protein [Pirellulales bacterium]|nr:discoidin domain-containing protein [Pirellulales bacterium]
MSNFGKNVARRFFVLGLSLFGLASAESEMDRFRSPPVSARPWVYWWWLNSNVTREGITRDLEEMKRQGIQGVMIFNAGGGDSPSGPKFLSPAWNALFKFALAEVSRLGMEASVSLCDGWCAGGPWIPAEAANKKLVWSETQIDGPRAVSQALPPPPTVDGFHREVAVLAIREKAARPVQPAEIRASSAAGGYCDEKNWPPADLADGDPNTLWRAAAGPAPNAPAWIDYVFSEPLAASAIFLAPANDGGPENCALQTSDDGTSFETVFSWTMAKGEAKRVEFPEVKAKIYRLVVQSSYAPDVRLAEMWLLRKGDEPDLRPGIKWWWFKSGNRSFWDWPKQGPSVMEEEYGEDGKADCRSAEVLDITSNTDKSGKLAWTAPAGRWTIFRFGYTLEGQRTRCSSTVIGYEADMLDPLGIETHFKHCAEPLLAAAGEYAGNTLKYLHTDSYEVGADVQGQQPTWSAKFREEFRARRGYDLLPYLPAMARRIVDSREKTDRFLFDIRATIGDLMVERCYGRLAELAHDRGVGIHCETGYGTYPHPQFDGLRAAGQCDVTMGEFWWGTKIMSQFAPYCNVIRSVASPAHIYGKKIVQAESFTSWEHFREYPAALKPVGDEAFCDGLNRVMFHQWTHQPNEDRPGYQYFAGTHIDRHVTWWNMAEPFLTYLTRCQYLLQEGRFHADVCYLNGEGSAKYVPGKKYLKPALPPGYNFDCINADVLLNRMTVKEGRLVLPNGVNYLLLVLPTERVMSPAVLQKVKKLIEGGATVLGEKPLRAPGLTNWPACDEELAKTAGELWGKNPPEKGRRSIGKGVLIWGETPAVALASMRIEPDFTAPGENRGFEFIHRTHDEGNFYFVSNQTNETKTGDFLFSNALRSKPELWDPVAGTTRELHECSIVGLRTKIPLTFAPHQSFFIVFPSRTTGALEKKPTAEPERARNFPVFETAATISGPWTVAFDPQWGGPEKVVFEELVDWTERSEEGIKHYSGTAVYKKTFDLPGIEALSAEERKELSLDLGKVNYLARVRLNGKDLGILWTAPWRVHISGAVQAKDNELEIEVVNTWVNRLVGDSRLPPEKRLAKTSVQLNRPPMRSGLLGPVTVQKTCANGPVPRGDSPKRSP